MTGKGKKIQNWGWIIKIGAQETLEDWRTGTEIELWRRDTREHNEK